MLNANPIVVGIPIVRISFSQNGHRWPNSDREIYSWSGKKQSLDERETRQTDRKQLWKVLSSIVLDSFLTGNFV